MTTTAPAETKQLIRYRMDSGVAIIELNDPPANTYSYEMNRQLDDAILQARMDNDVHVIVLTGAGEKFFCAGANIQMLTEVDPLISTTSACTPTRRCCGWKTLRSWSSPRSMGIALAEVWKSRWPPTCASRARMPARSACRK